MSTTTRTVKLTDPGWEALAEAHRKVTAEGIRARARAAREEATGRTVEHGAPQAPHESPEDFLARCAHEDAWAAAEAED